MRSIVAWLDNDHIVFSARKLPGWEATGDEHSRIISMNVTTGDYKDTGYRGRLICLNHLGDLMIRQGGNEIFLDSSRTKYTWLIGKWGGPLTLATRPDNSFITSYLCRFTQYGDQIHTTAQEKLTDSMHRKLPLLPGHGYFRESVIQADGRTIYPIYHVKPDGSSTLSSDKAPLHSDFYFNPWMNAYYERIPLRHGPRIFHPSGEFSVISIPKLLKYWSDRSPSMVTAGAITKMGMLWDVHQGYGDWRKQGLYLDRPEGLERVDIGRGTHSIVSPDGCRAFDLVLRDDPYGKLPRNYDWLVIDFCKVKNESK